MKTPVDALAAPVAIHAVVVAEISRHVGLLLINRIGVFVP